jgi:hypothetical protein
MPRGNIRGLEIVVNKQERKALSLWSDIAILALTTPLSLCCYMRSSGSVRIRFIVLFY